MAPSGNSVERLLVFTRFPEAGRVKTRLIPSLGAEGAAALHRELTKWTLDWAKRLRSIRGSQVDVYFDGGDEAAMAGEYGDAFRYKRQASGDLGNRLEAAIAEAFATGAEGVVVVGCDCPELDERIALRAFERLRSADVVLGPALDGGYYLIGLARPTPELFRGVAWGESEVLAATMRITANAALKTSLLMPLTDIDRPDDLSTWRRKIGEEVAKHEWPELSIVIPTLNEASFLPATLASIGGSKEIETIVVDGGSRDETVSIASDFGARVTTAPCGRARQLNWGGAMATGEILLFLHADTLLPPGFADAIRETLARPAAAGAFRLSIEGATFSQRLIASGANYRSRWLAAPYGDQGLFLRAALFRDMGGFEDLPLLEDLDFACRLRKRGRIAIARQSVTTSARRWRKLGPWRTTWRNQRIVFDWLRGAPVEALAERYRST